MSESSNPTPAAPARPKKNHVWIYFFVFVFVASVGVAIFMISYNLSLQLKPEQLEGARALWKEKGPKSYDMVYTKRLNDDAKVDAFKVKVRAGRVKEVLMNGKPLAKEKEEDSDPRVYHSMDRFFGDIERFMEMDQKPGASKVFVTAIFDPDTGALRRYIRRVMGTTLRIEMHITVTEVGK